MLANPLFISNNLNHCSRILTVLSINLVNGKYNNSPEANNIQSKYSIKSTKMSEENNKYYNAAVTPSTSGSSPSNWACNCRNLDNTYYQHHLNHNAQYRTEESVSNLMMSSMSLQNVFSTVCNNMGYCQFNHVQFNMQENLSKRYCHVQQNGRQISAPVNSNSIREANEQQLLSLRRWENANNEKRSTKPGFIFSLMCYNVLAQDLLVQHPYLYRHHDRQSLEWKTRWNNLFAEINKFSPDILCLQEVQETHIPDYFSLLETLGYRGVYKRRTGLRTDGCALYYKSDLISLVEHITVEFFQPGVSLLDRDNVAIVAKFAPKLHPTREFVVATTHLLYNPRRQDVRLAQMQVLMSEVERISFSRKSGNSGGYLPVIITGDLNSCPDSAVYDFITKGELRYEHLSPKSLTKGAQAFTGKVLIPSKLRITDNCQHVDLLQKRLNDEKTTRSEEQALIELYNTEKQIQKKCKPNISDQNLFSSGTLSHSFALKSVYRHGKPQNNEGTTFQGEWTTVDYIFYSAKKDKTYTEDKLKLLSRYRLPTRQEFEGVTIPNTVLGSDHLSLIAKFKLEF